GGGGAGGGPGGRAPGAAPAGIGLFGAGGVSGGRAGGLGGGRGGIGGAGGGGVGQVGGAINPQQLGGAGGAGGMGGAGRGARLGGRGGGGFGAGGAGGAPGAPGAPGAGAAVHGITIPGKVGVVGVPGAPGAPGQPQGPQPIFKEEVRIVADPVTNSLVVLATKRDYQLIADVLKKIDVVPRQVLLEVTIAEITLNKMLQFGVEWALAAGKPTQTLAQDTSPNSVFRLAPKGLPVGGLVNSTERLPSSGAFAVISDRDHFNIFINALQSRTNVKMLSAPHIMAADNREAHILVGRSIPILTSTSAAN